MLTTRSSEKEFLILGNEILFKDLMFLANYMLNIQNLALIAYNKNNLYNK